MKKKLFIALGLFTALILSELTYHAIVPEPAVTSAQSGNTFWVWERALLNDGREIMPKKPGSFGIIFGDDARFMLATDCNVVGGSYMTADPVIAFGNIFSTKKLCQESQEQEFVQLIADSTRYHFSKDGKLILDLKFNSGSVVFR